jgi:monovalent cation:H+ antiporter-2, CPA2 family
MNSSATGFGDALVVLGAAGLVIPAFARLRITPVIGFILVGILVGPFGLGALISRAPWLAHFTISHPKTIQPFAEFGVILLLFSIGLELSFERLWHMRGRLFGFGSTELIGAGLLIAIAMLMLGQTGPAALGLGIALSLSSTALVLPMSGTQSRVGQLALAMLLFEDLALVPIIFALGALAPTQSGARMEAVISTVGLGVITVAGMLLFGRWLLPPLFAQAARTKSPELFLSASLLVVILASLATTAVGLSPIVGALTAGRLIAETEYVGEVEIMTAPFKGLALGVFLITVGMSLDFTMIAARWPELLLAVAGVILIKTLVTTLLLRGGGISTAVATETGFLMASPSETTLIVLATATQAALISADAASFWTVVTAIGLTITPLLARIGREVARRIEWRSATAQPQDVNLETPHTIIIGFGRVGRLVAEMLETHGCRYVALEFNVDAVTLARREGKPVRFGDASRPATIDLLGIANASAVVLTMDDSVQAVRLTARLRKRFPELPIIARARDTDHAAELYRAGATNAVPETLESSLQLSEAVLVDVGMAVGPVIASIHEKRDELRAEIKQAAAMDVAPRLGSLRRARPLPD